LRRRILSAPLRRPHPSDRLRRRLLAPSDREARQVRADLQVQ
jgi:hypothetical protein